MQATEIITILAALKELFTAPKVATKPSKPRPRVSAKKSKAKASADPLSFIGK